MRTVIAIAVATLALAAGRADAQVLGGNWYNPYTGRYYSNFVVRNPWTGVVERRGTVFDFYTGRGVAASAGYNPWTGSFYRNRGYVNPWMGRYGVAGVGYNPWTGRYGFRYRW
jgi:hypothetical protein